MHINTDKGFIRMAAVKSPDNNKRAALVPPHPGHGIPVIL